MRKNVAAVIALAVGGMAIGGTDAAAGCRCGGYANYGPAPVCGGYAPPRAYYAPPAYYAAPPYVPPPVYGYYASAPYEYYPPGYGYAVRSPYYDRYYGYAGWRRW